MWNSLQLFFFSKKKKCITKSVKLTQMLGSFSCRHDIKGKLCFIVYVDPGLCLSCIVNGCFLIFPPYTVGLNILITLLWDWARCRSLVLLSGVKCAPPTRWPLGWRVCSHVTEPSFPKADCSSDWNFKKVDGRTGIVTHSAGHSLK